MFDAFLADFSDMERCRSAKGCKFCRSHLELSNEHPLAKIGVDTAENGPLKVCQKLAKSVVEKKSEKSSQNT